MENKGESESSFILKDVPIFPPLIKNITCYYNRGYPFLCMLNPLFPSIISSSHRFSPSFLFSRIFFLISSSLLSFPSSPFSSLFFPLSYCSRNSLYILLFFLPYIYLSPRSTLLTLTSPLIYILSTLLSQTSPLSTSLSLNF